MAWLKVDDKTHSHPSVLALAAGGDIALLNEALGWLTRCASYSADHELDGWVSEAQARVYAGPDRYALLLKTARAAGILQRTAQKGGPRLSRGLALDMTSDDRVFHILTKEELAINRGRRGSTRLQDARMAVRLRDGDQCRYCLTSVDFDQRKIARAGRYEHPNPDDRDTFVIACRQCDLAKGKRTPEQWHAAGGHLLQDPPARPHYNPKTTEWLTAAGLLQPDGTQPPSPPRTPGQPSSVDGRSSTPGPSSAPPERPSSPLGLAPPEDTGNHESPGDPDPPTGADPDPVQIRSRSDPDPSTFALPRQGAPGRVGTGRVRVGSGGPAPAPGSPARRTRGGRRGRNRARPTDPAMPAGGEP